MSDVDGVGPNIRAAREKKGWRQRELAAAVGKQQSEISDYENGNKTPGLRTITRIAAALGVTVDSLCRGTGLEQGSGDAKNAGMDSGETIAMAVYVLWRNDVVTRFWHFDLEDWGETFDTGAPTVAGIGDLLVVGNAPRSIKRLIERLNDYRDDYNTFPDPQEYLRQILQSAAKSIEAEIHPVLGIGEDILDGLGDLQDEPVDPNSII